MLQIVPLGEVYFLFYLMDTFLISQREKHFIPLRSYKLRVVNFKIIIYICYINLDIVYYFLFYCEVSLRRIKQLMQKLKIKIRFRGHATYFVFFFMDTDRPLFYRID